MKWIGQHIYDFVSRFRNDAIFETDSSKTTTISGADIVLTSDGSGFDPSITLTNTNSNNDSAYIIFKKEGDNGADNDAVAEYRYMTLDDTGSSTTIGKEEWKLADASNGAIKGKYQASMKAHLDDQIFFEAEATASQVINVDIARGSSSTTTIRGDLTISGGDISLSGTGRIQGIDTVTDATDAASKAYVDAAINSDIDLTSEVSGVLPIANGGTNSSSTTYCSLTANVSGTLPVANGGTGATSLTDNKLLTGTGTSAVTAEANATYDGTDLTLTSSTSAKPILSIENTYNDGNSGELKLIGRRSADASIIAANGDDTGKISFVGENNKSGPDPETITYSQILSETSSVVDGAEMGKLSMTVAKSGSLVNLFNGYAGATGTVATFGDGGFLSSTTFDTTITGFQSTTSTGPIMSIVNGTNDATGASLSFYNSRGGTGPGGAANQNGDDLGTLKWVGYDSGAVATTFAQILGEANEVTAGSEEGKLTLSVASHDAEMQPGLMIVSGDAEDEVDVTVGNGSTSVVRVPGFISIGGHTINDIDVAGEFVDSDEHLMTSAAIDDRIAAAGGGGGGSSKIHITWQDPQSYLFYLFNNNSWYSTGSSTLALLGSGSSPSNISSSNSEYGARIAIYTAQAACTVNSLTFNWYWSSSAMSGTKAFEFAFSKFTPQNGSLGTITMNSITATDNNGNYTEFLPYQETFTFSGGNATLAAGDAIAMHMRTTDGSSSQRALIYGTITLEAELS